MGRNPVTWLGSPTFPNAARDALSDVQLRGNLAHATSTIRTKRAAAVAELPDWQHLRASGQAIKDDVLSTGAELCAAADSSCLMHIGGGLSRLNAGTSTLHLAEILASTRDYA